MGLYVLPLNPKGPARPLLADPKLNHGLDAEISPDCRWVAYYSAESAPPGDLTKAGHFPDVDNSSRRQQRSDGSRSGRELFFLSHKKDERGFRHRQIGFRFGISSRFWKAATAV